MAALFGTSNNRSQSKNLVEFRAGKMHMKGNMVHPDKRKGLVYVYQSDDSLMHFCWKDRTSGNVDDVRRHRHLYFVASDMILFLLGKGVTCISIFTFLLSHSI